jgi:hypothetical protein
MTPNVSTASAAKRSVRLSALVLGMGLVVGAAACTNEGSGLGPTPEETRRVEVGVYLDRDGSRTVTVLDTVFAKARVALFVKGSTDTFKIAVTPNSGIAIFNDIPLGQYTIAIDPRSIGDSIQIQAIDSTNIKVTFADSVVGSLARLGYPEVSIREARNLPQGRRVFIRGIVLSGVQSFRDTTSHLSDSSGYIRLTRVALKGGLTGNTPGDSVSVLGVTSSRAGQPTLDLASISRFGTRPAPIPLPVGSGTAANAANGALDAALVQITGAIISDTFTVAPDFHVIVSDGTGSLTVVLDGNLGFPRTAFKPGLPMSARGVLVPNGVGGWVFKPRQLGDVTLN